MAGLGLKTEEFSKASQRLRFNLFIQIFNFGAVSGIVYTFTRLMISVKVLSKGLGDGMVICSCLPLTINMVFVLTKSSGGDEAAAIFNAAFGNMLGIFLSPALILGYIGVSGKIDLFTVFLKLVLKVALPIVVGQLLQKFSTIAVEFVKNNKKHFKFVQENCLIFIVYTVFCRTFQEGQETEASSVFLMIGFQFGLLLLTMIVAWFLLKFLFSDQPKLRVTGLLACTHKTVSFFFENIYFALSKNLLLTFS